MQVLGNMLLLTINYVTLNLHSNYLVLICHKKIISGALGDRRYLNAMKNE